MNTIPLIFNERQIERTVLGGENSEDKEYVYTSKIPCSLILLNRGNNHYRQQNIDNILRIGFSEVISIESSSLSYNLEDFAHRYPQVKFIVPLEKLSIGDMINIGIEECSCPYALVVWNDIHFTQNFINSITYEKLIHFDCLCISPLLQSSSLNALPIEMNPVIDNTSFSILPKNPTQDGAKTLYPFDFIGLYNCKKFMQLGGYDYTITNPYWQNLDFSLRAWLWGEKIQISTQWKVKYEEGSPFEDTTADITQLRFFLKNCAPSFNTDYSYIPISKFFSFSMRYPGNPFEAYSVFKDARNWVSTNKFRFKTDVTKLVRYWKEQVPTLPIVGGE